MSGTGSDGTSGIKMIKENGGLVIVQDPETAKFDGMPRSAMNTGLADFVLSPEETVDEILNFSNNPAIIKLHEKEVLFSDEETFTQIYGLLKKLKQDVIYTIVRGTPANGSIRVWSAGCSTGEEAYSIAILFSEVMEELNTHRDVKIFATDVDSRAIEQAGKGVFTESILDDVSPERLARFFTKKGDQYIISKDIRRMIIFAPHNMLSDPPFGKLDLII